MQKPTTRNPNPDDLRKLEALVQYYIDDLDNGEMHEDDQQDREHYIFEAAMEAFYGRNVWKWINSKL